MKTLEEFAKIEKKVMDIMTRVIRSEEFGKRASEVVVEMVLKGMEFKKSGSH
jgi:hypothetical protein